ncbi:MAG: hypothetical protein KGL46_02580 [Hyphomicrobiales bacterium]|nr:hypothetical protein [Hyphomicrobiales bacterium]
MTLTRAAAVFLALFSVPAFAQDTAKPAPATAAQVRPPADILLDCAKAPAGAVTKLPADLARWATVYCTKEGHIFNANDHYFGVFPDTKLRASFNAASIDEKTGADAANSYFRSIEYRQLTPQELAEFYKADPVSAQIVAGRPVWRLDLATSGGKGISFAVIDPQRDPFWVFPIAGKAFGAPAFFVVSLTALNKAR